MKEKERDKTIICISFGVIIFFFALWFAFYNNNEKAIERKTKQLAKDYYENYYYETLKKDGGLKNQKEVEKFLKLYEKMGIELSLDRISSYNSKKYDMNEELKSFKNRRKKTPCDLKKTKAILYPKKPYKKGDYTIEVKLDCGF